MDFEDLKARVIELRETQQSIASVVQDQPPDWRKEVVRLRLELSRKLGLVSNSTNDWQAHASASAAWSRFRKNLSVLRAALAEHQARWPAVALDERATDFQASTRRIRKAFDDLEQGLAELQLAASRSNPT